MARTPKNLYRDVGSLNEFMFQANFVTQGSYFGKNIYLKPV
jgi:hypothetical protein